MKPLVLVVEDEPPLQKLLAYNLEAAGFDVAQAFDGEEALTLIEERLPDLLLLDWMLPQLSGHRALPPPAPPAGDRAPADHHADGARRGARPAARPRDRRRRLRHQAVLAGRADRARPRRAAPRPPGLRRAGADLPRPADGPGRRTASSAASARSTSAPTEFRLLRHFLEHPGRVFSRAQLLDRVWGSDLDIELRTVDATIRRLRRALNAGGEADLLRTVRAEGYALDHKLAVAG